MPRRSYADLSLVRPRVDGQPSRLQPPGHLTGRERAMFCDLVNAADPRHFRPTDMPLLLAYCQQCCVNEEAFEMMSRTGGPILQDGSTNPWLAAQTRAIRSMTVLATRLRLSPQSRMNQKQTSRSGPLPSYYEQIGNEDDDDVGA